jgi:integrase
VRNCKFCGYPFDHDLLGKYGCPNCHGEKLENKKAKMKAMIQIPIPGSRKIQSRLEQSKRGQYKFRLKFGPRKIDKILSSKADNKEDAAEEVIGQIRDLNDPANSEAKIDVQPVRSNGLHNWREIFGILDANSDNGDKQVSSAKTAARRILRGIGDTEEDYPHQATKDRIDRWFESRVKRGKNVEDKLVIKKKLNKSIAQVRYGVFKKNMMKYFNLGPAFDLNTIKILKFKPVKYRRPTDDRHERADRHFREVVKFENPVIYGFYQVMRISAQRNVEVGYLKRDNLLEDGILNDRLVPRKNEVEREIPYPDGFTEEDRQFLLSLNPGGEYVLPGSDWDRQHGYSKKLNDLLRPFGFTAYQLRKEWACQLLNEQNVPVHIVAEMMGNTVQVLLDYYVAVKKTKYSLQLG